MAVERRVEQLARLVVGAERREDLAEVAPDRRLELAIAEDGLRLTPLDISDLYAVEVDFAEDLERANLFV